MLLLALVVLLALGYGAFQLGRRATDAVRDRIAKPAPVNPSAVTASSAARQHPPVLAIDGNSNRYWAPATTGTGAGQYVEMTFARSFRLLDFIVNSGSSPRQDEFLKQARPADVEVTLQTKNGPQVRHIRLADRPGPQPFEMHVGNVTRIRFTISSAYGIGAGRLVALGEVEFFKRP